MRAAMLHVIGDLLQSVGIVAVACCIYFRPDLQILDPILTIFFSVVMLVTSIPATSSILQVLMEATPTNIKIADLKKNIMAVAP